jgi:hypothetical protein
LKFIAQDQAARVKVLHETLTVISNDDKYPSKTIFLHGLWQRSGEGSNEPYAQEIIDAFGFTTKTGFVHTDLNLGDSTKLKGNEIKPSYFVRADTSLPVSIRQMGAYHTCCNSSERIQWYAKNSSTLNTVFTHVAADGQTLLPRKSSTAAASGTFIPTTAFGFKIGSNDYTDAVKNPANKIAIRVWRVFDANGNIIPDTYIISNDYSGTSATNYDYNDNSHYVTNIKPEIGAALFSTLVSTPSDLDFGEKLLQASDSISLSIKNNGQTYSDGSNDPVIKISSVQITGENSAEFSASMPPATTLTPQQVSSVKVKFKPVSEGLKIADLLIYYNSSLSPLRVPLYGIGKAPGTTVIVTNRIKAGSSTAVTINSKIWSSDTAYAFDNLQPFSNSSLSKIGGTDEDSLYLREQSSNANKMPFRYEIPVPNGDYVVRLHFAEIVWGAPGGGFAAGAGSRVMSVKIENQYRLTNFDVVQEVGAAQALIKNFPVTVTDGKLNIDFSATVDRPSVDAIEVYSFISSPLAEDILDLKGTLLNKDVELEWVTNNNVNTKYFEIQRSSNQSDFTTIAEIASNNQASQLSKYNFTDNNPGTSSNYYRVKEVDVNGKITYSKIIRIDFASIFAMQIYPNPGKRKINITVGGIRNNQKVTLSIQTISGSTLKRIPLTLTGEKIEVDVSSLKAGSYIISLSGENLVTHKKFLKIN